MTARIADWLLGKWSRSSEPSLAESYRATFSTDHGRRVLAHLMDEIYCRVYEGTDPQAALVQNARRSVVQEILENVDMAEHPHKYRTDTEVAHAFAP